MPGMSACSLPVACCVFPASEMQDLHLGEHTTLICATRKPYCCTSLGGSAIGATASKLCAVPLPGHDLDTEVWNSCDNGTYFLNPDQYINNLFAHKLDTAEGTFSTQMDLDNVISWAPSLGRDVEHITDVQVLGPAPMGYGDFWRFFFMGIGFAMGQRFLARHIRRDL